ncbi:MAG: FAD-dependent oxidoreductase [Rhodoferax sp.]|nr:FAD-dependent oxidoreductase [Rhodoferax sp.]
MIRLTELKFPLKHVRADLERLVLQTLGLPAQAVQHIQVFKRSIDARKAQLLVVYVVDVALAQMAQEPQLLQQLAGKPHIGPTPDMAYHLPCQAAADGVADLQWQRPVVVGFGPCGIFAALMLAQMGLKPIVLERGREVRQRTRDTWGLWRKSVLDPESNVQFGEGGAGTFSDGKLWSQIKDPRYLGRKVMEEFVKAGAPEDILTEAHPHIGTFKLVKVVENMRAQIIALGGEIRFEQRLIDIAFDEVGADASGRSRRVRVLTVRDLIRGTDYTLPTRHVVLAPGHSARDTFVMLHARGVEIAAKPFSIGFRIEHPQGVIDRARWGRHAGDPALGAAEYRLVHHAGNGRSVYSFCMCPGGTVVAATSEVGRVVTNGMSQYSRNERNANAGIVVGIDPADFPADATRLRAALGADVITSDDQARGHPLAGIVLQRELESNAYVLGGSSYQAPGQLVGDFLADRASTALGGVEPSYKPGVTLGQLSGALPAYAIDAIREALPVFGRKIKGFDMPDAVLTGVETRTSSPVRIGRGDDYQSLNVQGLYPAGEGASYAGGILSAGVDGIRVAEAVAKSVLGSR